MDKNALVKISIRLFDGRYLFVRGRGGGGLKKNGTCVAWMHVVLDGFGFWGLDMALFLFVVWRARERIKI